MGMLAIDTETGAPRISRPSVAPGRKRLLLAEDDDDTRRLLAAMLRFRGYEVEEARDGAELLACLESSVRHADADTPPFSAIIADQRMPYLQGLDVLAALGAAHWQLPFIVISAHVDDDLDQDARSLGAAALLRKPITLDKLDHAVRAAVRG
jgi:CheY-like chemotaxis protein